MRVFDLSAAGIKPAAPEKATHPTRGEYLRFENGEEGRGRKLVFFPLGARDFPAANGAPPPEQEYRLLPVSDGKAHILVRGQRDGLQLVLWRLSPGYRGGARFSIEGAAKVIAMGFEAQGAAGRMGGAECPVLLVEGPCVLRWTRTGRLYGDHPKWRAEFDGSNWTVEPDDGESDAIAAAFQ